MNVAVAVVAVVVVSAYDMRELHAGPMGVLGGLAGWRGDCKKVAAKCTQNACAACIKLLKVYGGSGCEGLQRAL